MRDKKNSIIKCIEIKCRRNLVRTTSERLRERERAIDRMVVLEYNLRKLSRLQKEMEGGNANNQNL